MIGYVSKVQGYTKRLNSLCEECSELNVERLKLFRDDVDKEKVWGNLLEELADVKLCITMLDTFLNSDEKEFLSDMVDFKLKREYNRVNKTEFSGEKPKFSNYGKSSYKLK